MAEQDTIFNRHLVTETSIKRYNKGILEQKTIFLAKEVPYTVFVNSNEILSIATLPTNLKELFVGFLVSEGVLQSPKEVIDCLVDHDNKLVALELDVPEGRIERLQRKGMLTSGCAGGMIFSVETAAASPKKRPYILNLSTSHILQRMKELDTFPGTYSITRGVHAASVASLDKTLIILEDLGRHNAVDKVVGYCFLNEIKTEDKLLLTTGRITSEVLIKAARSNFPIVISRSSASSLAIHLARQSGIDVVTYVRGGRFNYFSHGSTELKSD